MSSFSMHFGVMDKIWLLLSKWKTKHMTTLY